MKTASIGILSLFVLGSACEPKVGSPISLITGPAILAVKGEPAEVDPTTGDPVNYEALAVDVGGRVPAPTADITSPILWATCNQPKPPTQSNSVSTACLDQNALPGVAGDSLDTYSAPAPSTACSLFGPQTPPPVGNQPPIRPRDPDVTGGYYLPVRLSLAVPVDLRRPGMATADSIVAFQLERIACGLANAPGYIVREYNAEYTLNQNPVIASLTLQQPGSDPVAVLPVSAAAEPLSVPTGQAVSLTANWPADSVESYPAWDVLTLTLDNHREAMRVSWYATAGSFEHDVTGRTEFETETFADNTWTPGDPGLVHMWVVLHDSRGGTDFAGYDINVTP
ncbi:MAG: hypothetical protein ABSF35_15810 [Polyangia bacterium]|jgi:hypothetical protein